jgi:hypothetical protein
MGEPIVVETCMTYEDIKDFTWFSMLKRGKRVKPLFIALFFASVLAFLLAIYEIIALGFGGFMDSEFAFLFVVVLIPPGSFLLLSHGIKKTFKSSKVYDALQKFEFREDAVAIETTGGNLSGRAEYKYAAFSKVYEVEDAFYLFVNNAQAHLVAKRDMGDDDARRLAELLKEKAGDKYIKCF